TMQRAERGQAGWCEPEIFRVAGEIALERGAINSGAEAEALFEKSLQTAKHQNARSWQLRAATSLARLWGEHGRAREAHGVLAPIYRTYEEGLGTFDLLKAKALLENLGVATP